MKPKLKVRGQDAPVEVEVNETYADQIEEDVVDKWQDILDLAIQMFKVPNALIMRLHEDDLEVYAKSSNEENRFTKNKHAAIGVGHYCETVIGNDEMLMVEDATSDPLWKDNPDVKVGLTNYLGFPLKWPDGEVFGTMCLLDENNKTYEPEQIELLEALKGNIEKDLSLLDRNVQLTKSLDELEKTQDLLLSHEKNNLTNQLVANITHEISTPLNVALTSAAYLDYAAKRVDLNDEGALSRLQEGTDLVQRNLTHASKLLSSFKKIANDQGRQQDEVIDLGLYIKSVLLSIKLELKKNNTVWCVDIPERFYLKTKPGALSQIILCLIDNAMVHGFKNRMGNEFLVSLIDHEESVSLIFEDNGIGLDQSLGQTIFEPFVKSEEHEGAGLGLTVIKEIVEQTLSGSIECASDEGAIFTIKLPKVN